MHHLSKIINYISTYNIKFTYDFCIIPHSSIVDMLHYTSDVITYSYLSQQNLPFHLRV